MNAKTNILSILIAIVLAMTGVQSAHAQADTARPIPLEEACRDSSYSHDVGVGYAKTTALFGAAAWGLLTFTGLTATQIHTGVLGLALYSAAWGAAIWGGVGYLAGRILTNNSCAPYLAPR